MNETIVCKLLNEWLRPAVNWNHLPEVNIMAMHFFGEVWCALRDPDPAEFSGDIVSRERPPFIPGLCLQQKPSFEAVLPELGRAS